MTESERGLGQRWFDQVWNQGRREAVAEMLAPEAVVHDGGIDTVGPDGFYALFDRINATLSGAYAFDGNGFTLSTGAILGIYTMSGVLQFDGKGAVTGCSDLYVGTAALSERDYVHEAIDQADLILAIGHDTVEKPPFIMGPNGPKVIHIG